MPRPKVQDRMGAPYGMAGGRAKIRFEVVEFVRDLHEHDKLTPTQISELLPCIPANTLIDWLYYRTRCYA